MTNLQLCLYGWRNGIFTSQDTLQSFIAGFGVSATLVFIIFQASQVVVLILPGGLGCLAGVLLFGPWKGLLYNYIGICIGSILAFLVAKYYGKQALRYFFHPKTIAKYEKWTSDKNRFTWLFTIAIFLPIAPDDFLCYLAGTTEMTLSKFTFIILLGKPFGIALYSLGLMSVFTRIPILQRG